MFRYSRDEYIAGKQKEKGNDLLAKMIQHSNMANSIEIEGAFEKNVKHPQFLKLFSEISKIYFISIPRDSANYPAVKLVEKSYKYIDRPQSFKIPYIEFSFPIEDPIYESGYDQRHLFICFFTKEPYDRACQYIAHYVDKMNNLKVFW